MNEAKDSNSNVAEAAQPSEGSPPGLKPWQRKVHDIIFEAETPLGKAFDMGLLVAILMSISVVMLDTVDSVHEKHGRLLLGFEIAFTILFTIEYGLRIACVPKKWAYIFSFYGIIDLLAILPTYFFFVPGAQDSAVFRALRLIRVFRVLKLARFVAEADLLAEILLASRQKMIVFLSVMAIIVVLMGTLIYEIEGGRAGSDIKSIPEGMYWAIVTLTTVGYGDFVPHTVLGRILAAFMMILGYAMIVVPVGIFTTEFAKARKIPISSESCPYCHKEGHSRRAVYCYACGEALND